MNKPKMTIINFNGEVDEFIIEDPKTAYERTCSFLDQGLKNKQKNKPTNETKKEKKEF
tara:strand:+ start:981 stop:1154 length:174 start_codon:yes stop_codon:yes gene_type:complete